MKKSTIVLALSAFVLSGANALELGLVVDNGTKNVKRFDTHTGTFFGSFGNGFLNEPRAVAISPGGIAHVLDTRPTGASAVRRFNYNTGEYLGSTTFSGGFLTVNGSQLLVGTDGHYYVSGGSAQAVTRIHSGNGGEFGRIFNGGASESPIVESGGFYYSVDSASGRIVSAKAADFAGAVTPWPVMSPATGVVNAARQGALFGGRYYWANSGNDTIGSATLLGGAPATISVNAQLDQARCLAFSHGSTMYVGGFEVGSVVVGKILRVDALTGDQLGSFGTGFLQNPVSIAILAAPEPGTIVAVGAALAAVLIRRKKR